MEKTRDIEKSWDHWSQFFVNPDGTIDIEKLKNEIADLDFCHSQISKVYCELTGGKLSYTSYFADTIITLHYDEIQESYDRGYEDCKKDFGIKDETLTEKARRDE